jgi:outer membrane immunogenic protein
MSWVFVMRKFAISVAALAFSGSAFAADMAVKAPPAPPPPAYNWTGAYIGANIGGGWSDRNVSYSPNDPLAAALFGGAGGAPPAASLKESGVLGGLQLGYNWRFNRNWLVGLETDFDWSGVKGSGFSGGVLTGGAVPFTNTVSERVDWFGTARARLGYLPTNNLLTYITGGFAYGRIQTTGNYASGGTIFGNIPPFGFLCAGGGATCFSGSSGSMDIGWTVGAGFEYALWQNVTFKAEYLYVSLNNKSITETALNPNGNALLSSFNANFNNMAFSVARAGFNYHF